uniref:Phosphoinositide-3-kinase regulatory subunit 6 n=1 Tax=Pavo cristatus TaxID=9049 RepID=A0A8C9F1L2_PAVCR
MLYQRMVISEQSLRSDPYPYQEKIFIFADPELLSEAICKALLTDTEAARVSQSPWACMCYVITHAVQAALGEGCDLSALRMRLQVTGSTRMVEHWFQEVVTAVECTGSKAGADRGQHMERLQSIYSAILSSSPAGEPPPCCPSSPLPSHGPSTKWMLFVLQALWKELVLFIRPLSQSCEPDHLSQDLDNFEIQDIISDCECCEQTRFSVLSTDSGIERDLPPTAEEPYALCSADAEQSRLHRKGGIKKKPSPLESVAFLQTGCNGPGAKPAAKVQRRVGIPTEPTAPLLRLHTARIVLLGDDRILGRLAQAYHSLRKRETRRVFLTPRLNLQFYYVPVTGPEELCEVAAYLGRADPWYESNINTLCHMIPKLATMPSSPSKHLVTDLFITDVIAYYVRMGAQPVCFQVYAVKVFFSSSAQEPAEDVFLTELCAQVQDSISPRGAFAPRGSPQGWSLGPGLSQVVVSDRAKEVSLSLRSTGLSMKAIPANVAEGGFLYLACLNVNITEVVRINNLSGRSFSTVANKLKTCNIKISSTEQRPFTLCLDKDSRRTYRSVISLEVSPCLEPSYCLQKSRTMKFSLHEAEDVGLVKYMPKSLLLPINTFAGVIQ